MNLVSHIESILFVASKPLTVGQLADALNQDDVQVADCIETIKVKYNRKDSGIHILEQGDKIQMASNSQNDKVISDFVKDEITKELTKAQLETLTVIAYRGPITKPELEQIRGVNCSIILRNLLLRDLIIEQDDAEKILPVYSLSMEALAHLGVQSVKELPEYETLSVHEHIDHALES